MEEPTQEAPQATTPAEQPTPLGSVPDGQRPPWKKEPSSTADDLASLLTEFELSTTKPETKDASREQPKPQDTVDPVVAALKEGLNYDLVRGDLKTQGDVVSRLFQHQVATQNKNDFQNIVKIGNERLKEAGLPVGEDFVERFFASEAAMNPQLRQAFDMRYESPQHLRQYEKLADKAMGRLLKSAKSQPDPEATADKMAVAAAVRGASTNKAPPEPPVRYGDLTENEFAAEKKRLGIG